MADLKAPAPKPRPIPRKARDAIELIATGQVKTITAAAKRVGLARETLSRRLARPECIQAMKDRAARAVAMGAGRAAAVLNELVDCSSQRVRLEATRLSLQAAGIVGNDRGGVSVSVGIELKAGYVIDLSEPGQAPARIVGGEVIDAKPE